MEVCIVGSSLLAALLNAPSWCAGRQHCKVALPHLSGSLAKMSAAWLEEKAKYLPLCCSTPTSGAAGTTSPLWTAREQAQYPCSGRRA